MLVFIFCPILLLAPSLQGVWDFRTQFVFEAAVFLTGGFWLFREVRAGRPPAFLSDKRNIPLLCAAAFSLLSSRLSPVRALIAPEWWNFLAGIFVLLLASSLTPAERIKTDLALRAAAWFMVLLGVYQGVTYLTAGLGLTRSITGSLLNANTLALFTIMLIPLALAWRDFFLAAGLIIVTIWTLSAAALLGLLAAACFYAADNIKGFGFKKNWRIFAILAAAGIAGVSQLELRSVLDRLFWWGSALRMFADRPLLGFGSGAFAYIYPAFHQPDPVRLATTYAHNYYLEFLVENGLFASLFWGWAALIRMKEIKGLKKYALIAVFAHSFADFGLAVPAVFFIFCYLLGDAGPEKPLLSEADPAAGPGKKTAVIPAALGLACFTALCGVFSSQLKLERLRVRAGEALYAGDCPRAEAALKAAARLAPENPLVPRLLGQIRLRAGSEKKDRPALFRAAVAFERALILNPYNAGTYRDLEKLYGSVGEEKLKMDLLRRKREVFRWER